MKLKYQTVNNLKIADDLLAFINEELLKNTSISPDQFWSGFDKAVHELAPKNKELIKFRDELQNKINEWHLKNKGNKVDIGEYKKSFEYIKTANDIRKQLTKFDIDNEIKFFTKIKNFHENNKIENLQIDENKKKIIFILGMPRTGTSLVEQIISSHDKVYGSGELPFLDQYFRKYLDNFGEQQKIEDDLIKFRENYLAIIEKMTKLDVITDKAPLNFRWIGLIKLIFPNAIIIHCKRDPLESSWSIYKNDFSGVLFSNDTKDLANYYKIYQDLMIFWKSYKRLDIPLTPLRKPKNLRKTD